MRWAPVVTALFAVIGVVGGAVTVLLANYRKSTLTVAEEENTWQARRISRLEAELVALGEQHERERIVLQEQINGLRAAYALLEERTSADAVCEQVLPMLAQIMRKIEAA